MLFCNITLLNGDFEIEKDRYVGVKGSLIEYIGKERPDGEFGEEFDGRNKLLMPAFVNSHSHIPMTLMRGYGENLSLHDWLHDRIFPFEAKLSEDDVYRGTLLGIAEMIRFGIVSTTDMYFHCESIARAFCETGVKCNLSLGVTDDGTKSYYDLPGFDKNSRLISGFHGSCDGRIKVDMSLHAEYTSSPGVVREVAAFAKENGLNLHIHLSETRAEHEGCIERRGGMTPTAYFESLGVLENRVTAAHCVWVEEEDMDILKRNNVTVASCPTSNLKLASGISDVPGLIKKGVNVAVGTDSVASNNNLNMIEEIKLFCLLGKVKDYDPTAVTPAEGLMAATLNGAVGQGRADTGKIEAGKRADLIAIDIDKPYMYPAYDLLSNLVYAAAGTDVCLTMSDGKVLYRDGEYTTLDIEKLLHSGREYTARYR